MNRHPLYLCDKLQNWMKQINLRFTYKDHITIDLWDYFPLLKQGKCYSTTFGYLWKICEILYTDKLSSKSKHEQLIERFGFYPLDYYSDKIKNISGVKIRQASKTERSYIKELYTCFVFMQKHQCNFIERNESYDKLCQLLISLGKYNPLYEKLLSNQIIRVMGYILEGDDINIYSYLNTEKLDPRFHNNVLYLLSIDQNIDLIELINNSKPREQTSLIIKENISNIIRDVSIKRNWLYQQVLINCFESLIGSSEVPDNIFVHMNKLR